MDAQELRNLQEAYMEVVMGEEKRTFPFQKVKNQINKIEQQRNQKRNQITKDEKEGLISPRRALVKRAEIGRDSGYLQYHFDKAKKERQDINVERRSTTFYGKDKQKMTKTQREQVDLYDIILTHLLDEGYAETQEQAEVIMVNMSEDWREDIVEKTAMAKRGHDETAIRNKIAKSTGGGEAADRAGELADRKTFGHGNSQARNNLARSQKGDFRKTTSSSPGLHGYGYKSDDSDVKAKQAARGAQRGALTPKEKKQFGR